TRMATRSAWTDLAPTVRPGADGAPRECGQSTCAAGVQLAGFSASSTPGTITTAATTPSAEKLLSTISGPAAKEAIAPSRLDSASAPPWAEARDGPCTATLNKIGRASCRESA